MPITDLLAENDVLQIRVAVLDSLGNLQYFPGEDGDSEIVGPPLPTEPQLVAAISRVVLTRPVMETQYVAAISRVVMTRAEPQQQLVAAISRIVMTRTP
jgi:hypothetical protein